MANNAFKAFVKQLATRYWDRPEPTGVSDITLLNTMAREMDELYNLSWTRRIRMQDFDKMDRGYIASILDAIAGACTRFNEKPTSDDILELPLGFKVEFSKTYGARGPRAVIAQVLRDTHIKRLSRQYVRNFVKYGDGFAEILFQGDAVVGLQRYMTQQFWVNKDLKGYFLGPDVNGIPQAYQQKELREGTVIAGFEPWQVIHWKYLESDIHAYSEKSILDDIRDDWWKLSLEEQALVIARLTRAFPRTLHWLDMTGKSKKDAITDMKEHMSSMQRQQTRSGNMVHQSHSPDEDVFISTGYHNIEGERPVARLDKIEVIDPRLEGLQHIEDLKYNRSKLFTRVPSDIVGIVENNTTDITAQDLQFQELIQTINEQFDYGLHQLFDTALFLKGYYDVEYRIIHPHSDIISNWKHADAKYRTAMESQVMMETYALSRREILRKRGYTDDQIGMIMAELKQEMTELPLLTKGASQMTQGSAQV